MRLNYQQSPVPTPAGPPGRANLPAPPARPAKQVWGAVVLAAVIAVAAGVQYSSSRQAAARPASIRAVKVVTGDLERTLRVTGATSAEGSVFLRTPQVRGRRSRGGGSGDFRLVLASLVSNGRHVTAGEQVASFDSMYMQNRLDDIEAEKANLESGLRVVESTAELTLAAHRHRINIAKAAMDKAALDLKTAEVRSAIQVEHYKLTYAEKKAEYEALLAERPHLKTSTGSDIHMAELEIRETAVETRRAQMNLDRYSITAPIDGLFVLSELRRGSEIAQVKLGDELGAGQQFAQIVDPKTINVQAKVNQADIETMRLGSAVRVRFDAFPGLELGGKVGAIGALAVSPGRQSEHLREVPVTVKLNETDPRLIPNLSVSADIVLDRAEDTAIVPLESIFQEPDSGQRYAYVRKANGWEKRPIEIGLSSNVAAEVVSGLEPGEQVAAEMPSGAN
ncbi:MAG: HlyD family efflux transporter periplasmic adaptor subunit [Bryobacteraceae bacterium]|nr:HlyD family efflux transporter periplasmic adaptor subunit [Bryobacteraceae bacterium]